SIDDQVEDHLLQLDSISANGRQALRETRLQRNAILGDFAAGQRSNFEDRCINLYLLLPKRRFLEERSNATNDIAGRRSVRNDAIESMSNSLKAGRRLSKPSKACRS